MKELAAQETRLTAPTRQGRVLGPNIRMACADFWLKHLFWSARHASWYLRLTRPMYQFGTVQFSLKVRDATLANARRILGPDISVREGRKFGREVVGSFYDFVYDVGLTSQMDRGQLLGLIDSTDGVDKYLSARKLGKGAIIVTAHMGSFEAGVAALLEHETKIHVLFKRDRQGAFDRLRQQLRQRLGVMEAPIDDGWTVWIRLRDALQNNEAVLLQGDRVMPGQKGQRVKFLFGHVLLPTGPIKLALATGAPIIPVISVRRPGGRIKLFIEDAIQVNPDPGGDAISPAMEAMARVFEKYVAAYPRQWLVLDPAFCEDVEKAAAAKPSLQSA